jgi:hypothetical protein
LKGWSGGIDTMLNRLVAAIVVAVTLLFGALH